MSAAHDLKALYRKTVLEHSRQPRNFRRIDDPDRNAEGHNPLCGDKVSIFLKLSGGEISDISFEGTGCAICIASASILTEAAQGKDDRTAELMAQDIIRAFTSKQGDINADDESELGDMTALTGVRAYPSRVKCATLAWQTLRAALNEDNKTITTE